MERALVEEDPKFASTLRGTSFQRAARRRMILGGVVLVAGIGLLILAVLGSIVFGLATPSEAAAVGALPLERQASVQTFPEKTRRACSR